MRKLSRDLGGTKFTTNNGEVNTKLLLWLCFVLTCNLILTLKVLMEIWKR